MANAFDQFDNPFDQFDAPPEQGLLEKAGGLVEGAFGAATGLASAIPQGIRTLTEMAGGADLSTALERSGSSGEAVTYNPRLSTGKEVKKNIEETLGEYASTVSDKFAGSMSERNKQRLNKGTLSAADLRAENTERAVGDVLGSLYVPGIGGVRRSKPNVEQTKLDQVNKKNAELKAAEPVKNPFDVFDTNETAQLPLFEQDQIGQQRSPYGGGKGEWRTDENGIPVRTDISMEAANLEQPLQRNLWGDELARKTEQEQLPVTQAMDATRQAGKEATDLPTAVALRDLGDAQRALFEYEAPATNHLKAAVLEADSVQRPYIPKSQRGALYIGEEGPKKFKEDLKKELKEEVKDELPKPIETTEAAENLRRILKQDVEENRSTHLGRMFAPVWTPPKSQRGAINPEVFKEGFQRLKQLADGTWLRAHFDSRTGLNIEARKDGHIIGNVVFDKGKDELRTFSVKVEPDYQRQGYATELYQFAKELGNDIGSNGGMGRTEAGKGFAAHLDKTVRSPGNRQMGAVRIGEKKQQQIEKVIGERKNFIPENPDINIVLETARKEQDNSQWNYTESGATLAAMKRRSTAVLAASRIVQNADKRSDLAIRENVLPVEKAFRSLSKSELETVAHILKTEMTTNARYHPESLEFLNIKQQEAYAHMRAMFDDTLRIQNEARVAKGQEPITAMEAYLSSRWEGDFRRPIYQAVLDAKGNPKIAADGSIEKKLVWYLAAHTKRGLEAQTQALLKERPDLTYFPKEDHTVRYYKRQTDLQSQYTVMLDILGRDDPLVEAIARLQAEVEKQTIGEGASFLGQEKHFKEKAGVRGFVGDRPGKNPTSEALALIQQQIQYAKNAYKWSEMQNAAADIKKLVSDPELAQSQPNNVKYIKEYYKNAVGYGEDRAIAHLEDSIRNLGISPSILDKGFNGTKSFFILQKLGASAGYTMANMIQTANVLPHLADQFTKGYHGNPLSAVAVGIPGGIAMATGHYLSFFNKTAKDNLTRFTTEESNFLLKAFKYAEDNGITARSIYDEAPIEASFSTIGRAGNAFGKTVSTPEVFVRSMAYMTYVEFLRSSGKFKGNDMGLFQKAEELVNASMVDYRAQERPMVFAKLGIAGNFLNTLQTYPMNWYNQWNYMGREAFRGNIAPAITMFAVQYAAAGAMGIPGFEDMNKLYDMVKDHVVSNEIYVKMQESPFWSSPKLWMIENFGQDSVYGVLSEKSDIGMTSRVAAPGLGQMVQAPGGPIADIAKQGYNLGSAVLDPTNSTKWAQAGMSSSPPGLQGLLETAPFMEGKTFEKRGNGQRVYQRPGDIADHKGVYARTPREDTIRKFGLRSQKEVVEREVGYMTDKATSTAQQRARTIPDAFYDAVRRGDSARAKELYVAYAKLTGNGISDATVENQLRESYMTTIERSQSAAKTAIALKNVARSKAIIDAIRKENP
jgi:GNAT superfamily N-acetyltransferase